MSRAHGPSIVKDGIVFSFDAKNPKNYSGSGTSCSDSIIKNTGTLYNSPTYDSTSGFFTFNGSNSNIEFPNSTTLDNQSFSIEVLAKTNSTNQQGAFFEKGSINSQYSLFQENAALRLRINSGGVQNLISITTSDYINTTDWFHIVGASTSGDHELYINGISRGTGSFLGTVATSIYGVSIGSLGGTAGNIYHLDGSIALVRVYNKRLSTSEVKKNFRAVRNRFGI